MIAKLTGKIDLIFSSSFILEVNGVGYIIFASKKLIGELIEGEFLTIFTEEIIREDSNTLFGFKSMNELEFFRKLLKVHGVGAKAGIAIMSSFSLNVFISSVLKNDVKTLMEAEGVGKKMAERIVLEMKSFAESFSESDSLFNVQAKIKSSKEDIFNALQSLGYSRSFVEEKLQIIFKKFESSKLTTEEIIKLILKN